MFPQEVDKTHHNGHGFLYMVSWREAGKRDARWNSAEVKSPPFLVRSTGTYTPFEITVQAVNSLGSGPEPETEIGHSGEDSRSPFSSLGLKTRKLTILRKGTVAQTGPRRKFLRISG